MIRQSIFAATVVSLTGPAFGSHVLRPEHRRVLNAWLKLHPTLRLGTDEDCGCEDDIERIRTHSDDVGKAVADYHPYAAVGDFNGDGKTDFAVALVDTSKTTKAFTLIVFNGPFGGKAKPPAFLLSDLDLARSGLFFGPPRPKPYRLLVGRFESEGALFEPRNGTYELVEDDP